MLLLIVIQTTKDIITHGREQIEYELMVLIYVLQLRVPLGGTYIMKPTASSEGAQLWDKHHLSLFWFRKAGPTIILNIIQDV